MHVIGAATTFRLQEPPFLVTLRAGEKTTTLQAQWSGYVGHLQISGQILWRQPGLLALVFLSLVGTRMFILVERPFAQPFLAGFGYDAAQIGY
ncbi:MAG: hypothetical protein H6645_04325 [Caldilineaceae bacterium]|nr:hypothetical protein [Caldilineaceae bacterium]